MSSSSIGSQVIYTSRT